MGKAQPVDWNHDTRPPAYFSTTQPWRAYVDLAIDTIRTPSFQASALAVGGIVIRVLLTWRVIRTVHCSDTSFETLLPFLIAIYASGLPKPIQLGHAVTKQHGWKGQLAYAQYPLLALFWAHATRITIDLTSPTAGAICPTGFLRWEPYTPLAQCMVVFIDAMLITHLAKVKLDSYNAWPRIARVLLASAGVLLVFALFSFYNARNVRWALLLDWVAVRDLALGGSAASIALLSGIHLLSVIHPSTLALVTTSAVVYMHHLARIVASIPPVSGFLMLVATLSALTSMGVLLSLDSQAAALSSLPASDIRVSRFLTSCYIILLGVLCGAYLIFYPDMVLGGAVSLPDLIRSAHIRSDRWVAQANQSRSLSGAVDEYRRRHHVPPPPNFDKWYAYATAQNSVIIDDFSQISADLLPFWGTSPADLREQTTHMLSYTPWLNMAGIRIRGGKVDVMPGVPGSHAWMITAMREMIEPFAEHLPDLDFAMNLNDEPRVAVPYEDMQQLHARGQLSRSKLAEREEVQTFDPSGTSEWPDVKLRDNMDPSPYFTNELRNQLYYNFVAPACPPTSAARRVRWWSRKDACPACLAPHTVSIFEADERVVLDWTNATDLCHQPDLAYLHGFLLSPAAVVPTTMAFPVFSQTKAEGFADILLPSPWNFNDKATYDGEEGVPWSEKENTMFWRGSASDGYAARGSWQTSLRARLVHAASQFSWSASLLEGYRRGEFGNGGQLPGVDIGFVDEFQKCHQDDCQLERETFWGPGADRSPLERVPFEEHWRYRHLVDLDGAGFSGRFLPFLRSRSLVYRTGLFRTWFGERVHAWRHYVPVDVRLHELWDLLWFFGGDERGAGVAEDIAMEGRAWAAKALRREDMQVYMFRLLLEWGRLVDDQRESLGYHAM
ncbi:hypothetical protein ACHAQA_008676 [Verticillium albo-atrum]